MDLRPGLLDHLGLVPAIEWQAEEFSKRTGIECSIDISPQEISLDRVNSTTIFRIFQEALTNIARHAQAAMVEISLSVQDAHLTLRIHDDGIGITKNQIDNPRSFGLMGMRERSLFCNGSFSVFTEETGGTTVIVDIPLSEARKIDDTGTGN
jgi:signal transduction histidine kinase